MTAPVIDTEAPADGIPENATAIRLPVMAVEGMDTADGRYLEPEGIDHRALPISLLAQTRTPDGGDGHDNADIVGAVTGMVRTPGPEVISRQTGEPFPEGTFVWSGTGWMYNDVPAFRLVKDRALSGNSIDLSAVVAELEYPPGSEDDPNAEPERIRMRKGTIAATTLVAQPAFPDAYVEIDGELMAPEDGQAITAAAVSWRSSELGDTCAPCAAGLALGDPEEDPLPAEEGDPPPVDGEPVEDPEDVPAPTRTDGMVALVPADPEAYAVTGGDPADELHVTLAYLGDRVDSWTDEQRAAVHEEAAQLAGMWTDPDRGGTGPGGVVEARAFAHAQFNPDGGPDGTMTPCAVYLLGDGEGLSLLRMAVIDRLEQIIGQADWPEQHAPFVPHMTAGYGLDTSALSVTGPVQFDRIRVAMGGEVTDYPFGGGEAIVAASIPTLPSAAFSVPEPDHYQATTVTEGPGGLLYVSGHVAPWQACHIGFSGECKTAPRSPSAYAYFHTGVVRTDQGDLPAGVITMSRDAQVEGHANIRPTMSARAAAAHYDNVCTVAADVRLSDGKHGIWACGVLRGNLSADEVHAFRMAGPSGDWRKIRGALEMVAVLQVNTQGFIGTRALVAGGEVVALVAAGARRVSTTPAQEAMDFGTLKPSEVREVLGWVREQRAASDYAAGLVTLHELLDVQAFHGELSRELDQLTADALFNWVSDAGGLPPYIKRIKEHLQKEEGMDESRAIATAVNAAKKMCATGDTSLPGKQTINPGSQAEACAAVEQWEAKKAAS